MDMLTIGSLVVGLALLVLGGDLLVRGASKLAAAAGISPLVIGLTVVAYGTSAPEMAVSLQAGLAGNAGIAVANVVGSNIFNVLFILGLCALVSPLVVTIQLIRTDVPIMIGATLLAAALAVSDGRLQWYDGAVLFAGIVAYTAFSVIKSRRETAAAQAEYAKEFGEAKLPRKATAADHVRNVALILGGLVVLVVGARLLVDGAIAIARAVGVSEVVIGLTIVAAGTSLPEVAASIIATVRGERDIAIGNVVGSNIYNLLAILGLASMVTPGGLTVAPQMVAFDIPVMIAVAVLCLPIFFTGMSIARWEGLLFVLAYVAYTAYLVLGATNSPALGGFADAMVPLLAAVAAFLAWTTVRSIWARRRGGGGSGGSGGSAATA